MPAPPAAALHGSLRASCLRGRPTRHGQRLRPPLRLDATAAGRRHGSRSTGQLAGQPVVDLLAPLPEPGLHDPIERLALGGRRRPTERARRRRRRTAESTAGAGSKAAAGTRPRLRRRRRSGRRPRGSSSGRVARRPARRPRAAPGGRSAPAAAHPPGTREQRAGDVVRDVGDDLERLAGKMLGGWSASASASTSSKPVEPPSSRRSYAARLGSSSTATTAAPAASRRRVRTPSRDRPRLPGRRAPIGGRPRSRRAPRIGQEVLGQALAWPEALRAISRRSWPGVAESAGRERSGSVTPPATAARGSESPRGPRRRGPRRRAESRRPRRSWPRCRCTTPAAARAAAAPRQPLAQGRPAAPGSPPRRRPAPPTRRRVAAAATSSGQGIDDGLLEGGRMPSTGIASLRRDSPLTSRSTAVLRPEKRSRTARRSGPAGSGSPAAPSGRRPDGRAAGIGQAQQATDLVEGLAGRVVERRAEAGSGRGRSSVQLGVAAAQTRQSSGRGRRGSGFGRDTGQPEGVDVALDVVDADQRQLGRRPALSPR